jgi:hypothetical protein
VARASAGDARGRDPRAGRVDDDYADLSDGIAAGGEEYRDMALGGAKAARDMAAAATAKDGEAIEAAQAALQRAVVREDPLVDGLNEFCKAF